MDRKLLEEAPEVLRRGQRDEMIDLAARITAALSAPQPDAMELVELIVDIYRKADDDAAAREIGVGAEDVIYDKAKTEAASLIADCGKRVPRAMLDIIYFEGMYDGEKGRDRSTIHLFDDIAAKHGVKVEG